jgi:alkylation response protein AidB-like acyl-CoA dehydrogenase
LSIPREWGGGGAGFLDHTIAYEALGQGCPSTALAFNMHASVVIPLLQSPEVPEETKQHSFAPIHRNRIGPGPSARVCV